MQLNEATNNTGLFQDIDFICGTDSTSYPLSDKTRNCNRHAYKAVIDVLKHSKRWMFKDANLGSLPTVLATMTNGTHEVALPAALKIRAVEVQDINGNWTRLKEIDLMELQSTITDAYDTPGIPTKYALVGSYIWLLAAPDSAQVTLTNGLKFWIEPEIDIFVSTDTNQEPGIAEPFHRIISIGSSIDWFMVNDTTKVDRWRQEYEQERMELREFYSSQNMDVPSKLIPSHLQSESI